MNPRKKSSYALGLIFVLLIVALVFPFTGGAASGPQNKAGTANTTGRDLPNYDAFGTSTKRVALPAQASNQNPNQQLSEGGHLVQSEPRLGVPTFLWTSEPGPALSLTPGPRRELSRGGGEESIARDHLSRYASRYRLSAENVANIKVSGIHDTGKGAIIVKFRQEVGGVEVFRDQVTIIMNRDLQLVAISGYLTGDNSDAVVAAFNLQPAEGIAKALSDLIGTPVNSTVLKTAPTPADRGATSGRSPYQSFTTSRDASAGFVLEDPARVKQVMYHLVDEYVPAYYIETNVLIPVEDSSSTDLSGSPGTTWINEAYSYVISAVDGQLLFRKNLIENDSYTYRVWADPVTKIPYDTVAGNDVHPKVIASPDGVQYPFVAPNDITLQNYPFNRNDPWLPPGATETVGNNANAYVDLFNPDGYNPVAAPGDPATGDFRAQITAPGQFLHTHTPDGIPANAEARQGAIQQLFYNVNFLHDWFYEAGFDEASGNAQSSNFGRGGAQNDPLRAEAQDVSGRNNANMLTPADGISPRMQMYLFDSNAIKYVDVLSPAAAAGQRAVGTGQFGPQVFDVTNQLVQPSPASGCTAGSYTGTAGKFVMVDREPTATCSIGTKLTNAMAAGAAGFILVNLSTTPNSPVNVTGSLPGFTIPFLSISWNDSLSIKTQLAVPNVVTARMRRDAGIDRDGSVDNQIVFHEWGHFISNRLIGDSAGLNTTLSGGMGEGWGDFTAMLLTVRQNDSAVPSNSTFNGAYALATYATSGGNNNGYYFGIRRYPYSTDLTKNPLTFQHIQDSATLPVGPPVNPNGGSNAEVHNTGEVWASMLWECYASLLRDTQGASPRLTFKDAQDRMKYYLVAAYKMTPNQPTLLEARDALLAAAYASDPIDYEHFFTAFAKRGAGFGAVSPDRFTLDNNGVTESFTLASDASFETPTLDDTVNSCDGDGVLDSGETGHLIINLRNIGLSTLASTTGTVTTTTPGVTFPNGGNVSFSPINPVATGTVSVDVTLAAGIAGVQSLNFQFDYTDPAIGAPRSATFSLRGNTNTIPAASATDTVEPTSLNWTPASFPPVIVSGGFTFVVGAATPFHRKEVNALQHVWHVDDIGLWSDERLTSPVFTVDGSGSMNLQFDHSWGFEFDAGGNYDGGVIEISVNGGAFSDFGAPAYNGVILNYGGANNPNPLKGRNGFIQNSAGTVHTSLTQAIAPGSTVQVRFRVGTDGGFGAAGWDIDNIAFNGVVETPFGVLVADPGCPPPGPTPVVLALSPSVLPAGTLNSPYPTTLLSASGGSAPYSYTITPFSLPPGLVSDIVGGDLQISGTPTHSGNYPLTIVVNDSASHTRTFNYTITINKLLPVVSWSNPADITYPTPLSGTQLNATANVPGTLTYAPPSGTVLNAGNGQTLSVTFVPTDPDTYSSVTQNVVINVLKATSTITWNNPADITYPTPLSAAQLNATANVPGTFTYTPPSGTVLEPGNAQTLSVNFVPTDSTNFGNDSKSVSINVLKATPIITWNNPADITYPTALSPTQLNATASVPGTLTYTPNFAALLDAGNAQTLSVSFVPTDSTHYNNASKDVSINVLKATPTITWSNPADITYPTALSAVQLNATASVPGTLTYTPAAGTVLNVGNAQSLSVNFVPTDTTNYNNASQNVSINVLKGTPTITWSNPANITYPTPLSATQLNATASVPGTLTYTPAAGTVLNVGNGQLLSVNFVPTDTTNYNNASQNVSINVLRGTPTITWNNPGDISYPTALSATQLNATASAPGTFTYTPAAGTVLNAGNAQTLSVNFVPTDTANYNNASQNVLINVLKANQTINFGALADRPLGSAPFSVSGTATSNLPVTFSIFSGPATINSGTVTLTGIGDVTVRAAQSGDSNYNAANPVDQVFTVTQASTAVSVASDVNPSTLGQAVTFTATVVSAAGTPTGTITFKDGGATIGSGMLNGAGVVTLTTSTLTIGTHLITVEYGGDANSIAGSATLSGGQVVNSPPNGIVQFSAANYSVREGTGSVAITVTRTGNTTAAATVDYGTNDGSAGVPIPCSSMTGTAGERCDFTPAVGTVQFAAGEASKTFTVLITDDSYVENAETLQLALTNPGAGSQLGSQSSAVLTITDDDGGPSPNPVDNAGRFVEQLYHDFLNRAPDSAGLAFWTNEITSCGTDQACISSKRENVAAAFFLSIEFQQTGYLVERLYKTAYGDATGSSTLGGLHMLSVPVVRSNEFLPDTQEIGLGVAVGQTGWEAALENNKQAFVSEFVLRSRFATAYPGTLTNAMFVDTLNANAGNPLTTAERNQLVSDLDGAVKTRAEVLRAIAENPVLASAESNRAFVLMQYFGFLRRNPNDAPDTDYTGYDFWLTKLNQANGNFVNAEMVKAFITSGEYRQRFGN